MKNMKIALGTIALASVIISSPLAVYAAGHGGIESIGELGKSILNFFDGYRQSGLSDDVESAENDGETNKDPQNFGQNDGGKGERMPGGMSSFSSASASEQPTEIVYSDMESSAASLSESTKSAVTIKMTNSYNNIKIDEEGTYIVTGTCADGNITVKKGTQGVVLILKNLDLTSAKGAAISVNKGAQVKMIIEGNVKLTDAEDPADENSADTETADAFDGAAIKVKAGADLYITGGGMLTVDGSDCKNGIKANDDPSTVLVIDGPAINITAANDAINAGYDLTILSGTLTVSAEDDAIHADRILTIGGGMSAPVIRITECSEGLEGSVVNILDGDIEITASDDAVNGANSDGTYTGEMDYSINVLGGKTVINSSGDGLDSNGNINLIAGELTINCRNNGGEGGIDYEGSYYISDEMILNNNGGITMDSGNGGRMGGKGFGGMQGGNGDFAPKGDFSQNGGITDDNGFGRGGQMPGMNGKKGGRGRMQSEETY